MSICYNYQATLYDCQDCSYVGNMAFSNKEPLTVGKFYSYVSVGNYAKNNKVKITSFVGSSNNSPNTFIEDKNKKDTCQEVLCQGFATVVNTLATNTNTISSGTTTPTTGDAITATTSGTTSGSPIAIPIGSPPSGTSSVLSVAKKPNYLLYGVIIASAILVYKNFFNKKPN